MGNLKNKNLQKIVYQWLIPLCLLLYPLAKTVLGVDYMDSMYSPGNFVFFPQMEGTWVVATFLANVIGYGITLLPGAGTYLGLRVYTNLFISLMALISYFWLKKRIPAWMAALGEMIAIGLCWCPTTILYNYLTYLFMLVSLLFLYKGLTEEKKICLVAAGVFLGLNLFVRFPNIIETGFIVAVWFYGFLKRKKPLQVLFDTIWCMCGYFLSVAVLMGILILLYGADSYAAMIRSLFSMTDTASSYKPVEMLLAIVREYWKGLKWPLGMAAYALAAGGAFGLLKNRFQWVKKGITVLGILVLLRFYYAKGMFNINYHSYPSIFQWGVCFLILTVLVWVMSLFHSKVRAERKLLYILLLLVIVITPVGSNNNLFPIMNNLFLVAPVAIYSFSHIIAKGKKCIYAFPARAMLAAVITAVFVQSLGFGLTFSFRGSREGEKRDTKITNNVILKGMYTNAEKAQAISELTEYWETHHGQVRIGESGTDSVLLFGHIPGVSYFLNVPSALSTSWPDLASYTTAQFEADMEELKDGIASGKEKKPTVIISYGVYGVITDDANVMEWYENNIESGEEGIASMQSSEKLAYLADFLQEYGYRPAFINKRFVAYEP